MDNILFNISVWALPIIFAVTVHEASHGYVAKWLGDNTAFVLGRLTLNPIKHIDLLGTIIVPVFLLIMTRGQFVFGWAKPVPVITRNLKKPKRDMALVAAAGPLSNFAMALGWAILMKIGLILEATQYGTFLFLMGFAGIKINLILALLNMIPIPPLDGSRVLASFLPAKIDYYYQRVEPFGFFILLGLMFAGAFEYILFPPFVLLVRFILHIFNIQVGQI